MRQALRHEERPGAGSPLPGQSKSENLRGKSNTVDIFFDEVAFEDMCRAFLADLGRDSNFMDGKVSGRRHRITSYH